MKKFLALMLIAGVLTGFAGGCNSDGGTSEPEPLKREVKKSKAKSGRKKKKGTPDPIGDMLKIERKESKPLVTESDILSERERKAFEATWKEQFDESEDLHRRVMEKQIDNKKKQRDYVFF